jgi:tetratricopeptide (TPR) repeat protein
MLRDLVEFQEANEFALEEGLVRGALRTVKKRLSEISLRPEHSLTRRVAEGERHAMHAHAILHRGTTKHLVAAISSFRRALEADHFCALAHAGLAEALVRKCLYFDGDEQFLAEAREHASRALAIDPECAEAHTSLGFAWHMSGHLADAQREYRLAMQLDNDEWLAHRLLGAVLARGGNFRDAAPLLRRAVALKPTHVGSYDHMYNVLQRLDRYEESLQIADQGIGAARAHLAEVPDNQEARLHMAMLLARLGQSDEARAEVARAREIAPKDGYTAYHAANVLALVGDLDEAVEQLAAAQARGYFIRSELGRNTDLDVLRGLPEFQQLVA